MSRPPPRRGSSAAELSTDERGQTLLDYAAGVGVFLLAVAFVFALVPTVFSPYQSPIESDQTAQAERLTTELVAELGADDDRGRMDPTAATELFSPSVAPTTGDQLRSRYGFGGEVQVNVSLVTATGAAADRLCPGAPEPPKSAGSTSGCAIGDEVGDHPVAVSVTVLSDGGDVCLPTCRLMVRVW